MIKISSAKSAMWRSRRWLAIFLLPRRRFVWLVSLPQTLMPTKVCVLSRNIFLTYFLSFFSHLLDCWHATLFRGKKPLRAKQRSKVSALCSERFSSFLTYFRSGWKKRQVNMDLLLPLAENRIWSSPVRKLISVSVGSFCSKERKANSSFFVIYLRSDGIYLISASIE